MEPVSARFDATKDDNIALLERQMRRSDAITQSIQKAQRTYLVTGLISAMITVCLVYTVTRNRSTAQIHAGVAAAAFAAIWAVIGWTRYTRRALRKRMDAHLAKAVRSGALKVVLGPHRVIIGADAVTVESDGTNLTIALNRIADVEAAADALYLFGIANECVRVPRRVSPAPRPAKRLSRRSSRVAAGVFDQKPRQSQKPISPPAGLILVPMDRPDDDLLRSFLSGDRAALEALALRYEGPLLGLATGLLDGHRDMAADAVQETWLRLIRFGHTFRAGSSFKTWLYRIAINQCRDAKAKSRAVNPNPSDPPSLPDPAPSDDLCALRAHIQTLHPDRRLILLLCYHQGMTHTQAADILGLPLGTLKTRLHASLTELRARLNAQATA